MTDVGARLKASIGGSATVYHELFMKSKTIIAGLLSFLLAMQAFGQADATQVAAGRAALVAHNITNANSQFAAALAVAPTDPVANLFYAATRLLVLPSLPAGQSLLNTLGVAPTNSDIYHWHASLPKDTNGILNIPAGVSATVLTAYLRGTVIPALLAAQTNLAAVTSTNFVLSLAKGEIGSAVTIDYGDVLLLRFMVDMAAYFSYTINSWNVDVQFSALRSLALSHELSLGQVLTQYPALLTFSTTNDLASAKAVFSNAVTLYFQASAFIRARPAGEIRLFTYDPSVNNLETKFRKTLADLQSAFAGAVRLSVNTNYSVNMALMFNGSTPWRSFLPEFSGRGFLLGTVDSSFGGVLNAFDTDTTVEAVEGFLATRFTALPNFSRVHGFAQQEFLLQLNVLSGRGYVIESSADLLNWSPEFHLFATNHLLSVADPNPGANPRRFFRAREESNTLFENRYVISGLPTTGFGNNQNAISEPGDPPLSAGSPGGQVNGDGAPIWWTWTAPVSGEVGISAVKGNGIVMGVFTGKSLATLAPVANLNANQGNSSEFDFNAIAGTTYQVAVENISSPFFSAQRGNVTLQFAGPPPNDNFANRLVLSGASIITNGCNILATRESGDPLFFDHSVWYSWTAPSSGTATFSASGAGYPYVSVYIGSSLSGLTSVPTFYLSSGINSFAAVGGTTYQIQVDSYQTADFVLTLNFFAGVYALSLSSYPDEGGTVSVNPSPKANEMYLSGTTFTLVAAPAAGFIFGSWDWEGLVASTNPTLKVVMNGATNVYASFIPVNDNFADRITLTGTNAAVYGDAAGATLEQNEPSSGNNYGATVWYSWTALTPGAVVVSMKAGYGAAVSVYTGNSIDNLTVVAGVSTQTSSKSTLFWHSTTTVIAFDADAGTTYQFQAGGYDPFLLTLNFTPPGPPAITSQPASQGVLAGGRAEFDVSANGFGTLSYQWQFNATNLAGATGSSLVLTNVTANKQGPYRVIVSNGYGSVTSIVASLTIVTPPANDLFANATVLSGTNVTVLASNFGASKEPGEPNHASVSGGASVWWSWTPSHAGVATVDTLGSSFDTTLAVYTGNSVSSLSFVASNDDYGTGHTSLVSFNASAGVTYKIAVDGYNGATGNITLHVNLAP